MKNKKIMLIFCNYEEFCKKSFKRNWCPLETRCILPPCELWSIAPKTFFWKLYFQNSRQHYLANSLPILLNILFYLECYFWNNFFYLESYFYNNIFYQTYRIFNMLDTYFEAIYFWQFPFTKSFSIMHHFKIKIKIDIALRTLKANPS